MIQDHVGAETPRFLAGMEKGIDHAETILQPVGEGAGHQGAVVGAVFHDMGVHRRFLDHGDIVEQAHVAHAAARMARIQIGAQQGKLFAGGFGGHFGTMQILVAAQDAFLVAAGGELAGTNAHRHAGGASFAGRAIGDGLAAAETGMGEGFRQRLGQVATQPGKDLAFDAAGQVRAGPAGGEEKLRYACAALVGHVWSVARKGLPVLSQVWRASRRSEADYSPLGSVFHLQDKP